MIVFVNLYTSYHFGLDCCCCHIALYSFTIYLRFAVEKSHSKMLLQTTNTDDANTWFTCCVQEHPSMYEGVQCKDTCPRMSQVSTTLGWFSSIIALVKGTMRWISSCGFDDFSITMAVCLQVCWKMPGVFCCHAPINKCWMFCGHSYLVILYKYVQYLIKHDFPSPKGSSFGHISGCRLRIPSLERRAKRDVECETSRLTHDIIMEYHGYIHIIPYPHIYNFIQFPYFSNWLWNYHLITTFCHQIIFRRAEESLVILGIASRASCRLNFSWLHVGFLQSEGMLVDLTGLGFMI